MKILVSNDDGIQALGLQTLVKHLAHEYEVYVVAPDRERSATSHALTLHQPIRVDEVEMDAPVKKAYAVGGTPSDCVKLALSTLLDVKPDLVISGINHGPNLGTDVLYSGTVSAAIEGGIFDIRSIAVSLVNGHEKVADFNPGAQFMRDYLHRFTNLALPPKTILNINLPGIPFTDVMGVKLSKLATRMYLDTYEKRIDPRGNVYYWLVGELVQRDQSENADIECIRNNMISVSPVRFDMMTTEDLSVLKEELECPLDHGKPQ